MKKLFIIFITISVFLLVGCVQGKPQEQISDKETNNTDVENHINADDIDENMAQQFLMEEINVDNFGEKKNVSVYDLYHTAPLKYSLVDIDGDGARELAFEFDPTGDKVIIDMNDGVSTAYYFPIRACNNLKKDGTMSWSASAFNNGIRKIRFLDGEIEPEDIIIRDTTEGIFILNGKRVSEDECNIALTQEIEKEDVNWIDIE